MSIRDLMAGYATYTTAAELSVAGAELGAAPSVEVTTPSVTCPSIAGDANGTPGYATAARQPFAG